MSKSQRNVEIHGHLLDAGLMNEVLDLITEGGGTFEVFHFDAGRTRNEPSLSRARGFRWRNSAWT